MSLIVKQEGGSFDFQICPQGNHLATCFSVIDLGVQEVNFSGETSFKRKVRVSWELPNELITDGDLKGQPFSISKNYTLSLNEKAVLYKDLISWRGRAFTQQELEGFELFNILRAGCMLNVIHVQSQDGQKTYANVSSVSQLPKGMERTEPVNVIRRFNTEDFSQSEYESFPEWLKAKINLPAPVVNISQAPADDLSPPDIADEEIPF